jgi:hypothetical protein
VQLKAEEDAAEEQRAAEAAMLDSLIGRLGTALSPTSGDPTPSQGAGTAKDMEDDLPRSLASDPAGAAAANATMGHASWPAPSGTCMVRHSVVAAAAVTANRKERRDKQAAAALLEPEPEPTPSPVAAKSFLPAWLTASKGAAHPTPQVVQTACKSDRARPASQVVVATTIQASVETKKGVANLRAGVKDLIESHRQCVTPPSQPPRRPVPLT